MLYEPYRIIALSGCELPVIAFYSFEVLQAYPLFAFIPMTVYSPFQKFPDN